VFLLGPGIKIEIPSAVKTLYSIGAVNPLATIDSETEVIILSEGSVSIQSFNPFRSRVFS
jgi:hypothetical protein